MTKVYLVWSGEYSDKDVEGVFSTREAAEAFAAELDKQDGFSRIEEKDLDSRANERAMPQWSTFIGCETGTTTEPKVSYTVSPMDSPPLKPEVRWVDPRLIWGWVHKNPGIRNDEPVIEARSGISADHALKLAAEARQKWLRTQELRESSASS